MTGPLPGKCCVANYCPPLLAMSSSLTCCAHSLTSQHASPLCLHPPAPLPSTLCLHPSTPALTPPACNSLPSSFHPHPVCLHPSASTPFYYSTFTLLFHPSASNPLPSPQYLHPSALSPPPRLHLSAFPPLPWNPFALTPLPSILHLGPCISTSGAR